MTIADQILQLELHAENLKACRSFEDYQRCHVAWIDLLVLEQKAKLEFVDKTEFVTKIKDATGKITETTVKTQWQVAATDDPRTDPVHDDRAARRTDLTPSQQAKLDLAKGQSDTIKGKIK